MLGFLGLAIIFYLFKISRYRVFYGLFQIAIGILANWYSISEENVSYTTVFNRISIIGFGLYFLVGGISDVVDGVKDRINEIKKREQEEKDAREVNEIGIEEVIPRKFKWHIIEIFSKNIIVVEMRIRADQIKYTSKKFGIIHVYEKEDNSFEVYYLGENKDKFSFELPMIKCKEGFKIFKQDGSMYVFRTPTKKESINIQKLKLVPLD